MIAGMGNPPLTKRQAVQSGGRESFLKPPGHLQRIFPRGIVILQPFIHFVAEAPVKLLGGRIVDGNLEEGHADLRFAEFFFHFLHETAADVETAIAFQDVERDDVAGLALHFPRHNEADDGAVPRGMFALSPISARKPKAPRRVRNQRISQREYATPGGKQA